MLKLKPGAMVMHDRDIGEVKCPEAWSEIEKTGSFVQVNTHPVFYRRWGPLQQQDNIVVLLHGIGDFSYRFEYLGTALGEAGWAVFAPDLYGRGHTPMADKSVKHDARCFIDLIHDFLLSLGVQSPIRILGHSMGGARAAAYAASYPSQVTALALLSPAGLMNPGPMPAIRFLCSCWWRSYCCFTCLKCAETPAQKIYRDDFHNPETAQLFPWYVAHQNLQRENQPKQFEAFAAAVMAFPLFGLEPILLSLLDSGEWEAPVLLMWGANDNVIPTTDNFSRWKTILEGSSKIQLTTKLVEDTSHCFFLEKVEESNGNILAWLGLPSSSSASR